MNIISYDIIRAIDKIDSKMILEIDKVEEWSTEVKGFEVYLSKCDNDQSLISALYEKRNEEIVAAIGTMKTSHFIRIIKHLARYDFKKFTDIIDYVNENSEYKGESQIFSERITLLYRITVFPKLFSNESFMIIYNKIKENL